MQQVHILIVTLNKKAAQQINFTTNYVQTTILVWHVNSLDVTMTTSSFLDNLNSSL